MLTLTHSSHSYTHTCTYTHSCIYSHVHTHTHSHSYIHAYTYTLTLMHTHMYTFPLLVPDLILLVLPHHIVAAKCYETQPGDTVAVTLFPHWKDHTRPVTVRAVIDEAKSRATRTSWRNRHLSGSPRRVRKLRQLQPVKGRVKAKAQSRVLEIRGQKQVSGPSSSGHRLSRQRTRRGRPAQDSAGSCSSHYVRVSQTRISGHCLTRKGLTFEKLKFSVCIGTIILKEDATLRRFCVPRRFPSHLAVSAPMSPL